MDVTGTIPNWKAERAEVVRQIEAAGWRLRVTCHRNEDYATIEPMDPAAGKGEATP